MLKLNGPGDIKAHLGQTIGPSGWVAIDQRMIDTFAEATGDHQWIHVDPERAARDLPGGTTIAHGYLMLSLLPRLSAEILEIGGLRNTINYGSDKVRFINMVPAGARVRLTRTFTSLQETGGGLRAVSDNVLEIEGETKPALVAETIVLFVPAKT